MITEEDTGAIRHAMTTAELNQLYRLIDEFESDCTIGEHAFNANYITSMKTAIHQRLRQKQKESEEK